MFIIVSHCSIRWVKQWDNVPSHRDRPACHPPQLYLITEANFWLVVVTPNHQKPSKSKAPSLSLFWFFSQSFCCPKRCIDVLPVRSALVVSTLQHFPHHRHHPSFDYCVDPSSGGHLRPRLHPSLYILMGGVLAPQTREPAPARASPTTGRL